MGQANVVTPTLIEGSFFSSSQYSWRHTPEKSDIKFVTIDFAHLPVHCFLDKVAEQPVHSVSKNYH